MVGKKELLPEAVQKAARKAEDMTRHNNRQSAPLDHRLNSLTYLYQGDLQLVHALRFA